jgi:hypothetical protein
MKDTELFEKALEENGLQHLLVSSHEEAAKDERPYNVVYMPNADTGRFDVYLTAKKNGSFGEFTCWVESEFEEDPELINTVISYIVNSYAHEDVEAKLWDMNPYIRFEAYDREEYSNLVR